MNKLLIIDDENSICSSLKFVFEDDYDVYTATNIFEVKKCIEKINFDLVLLDLKFGDIDGIDILNMIKNIQNEAVVIIMTAYGTIESSIKAIKTGAYDYISKPLDLEKLKVLLKKALENKILNDRIRYLEEEIENIYGKNGIIGKSKVMKDIFHLIDKIKDIDVNILIEGSSGTGKELIARAIHFRGIRKCGRFEVINCGAIPANLIESELFGYEKGAFTGANQRRKGRFELAHEGTIFLDEIGELDINLQVKLLRAIQEKEIFPLGAESSKKIDVRIISATNKELKEEVKKGKFREDLYFRLNVVSIKLPDLKDRKEDIPLLIEHFIKKYAKKIGKKIKGVTRDVLEILENYDYPGNIRELENIIERAIALTDNEYIDTVDLPVDLIKQCRVYDYFNNFNIIPVKIGQKLENIEKEVILRTLRAMENNKKKTAEVLGISERSLRYKLKKYNEYN
ncbi:regulatory protein, Fis family [Caminicella sporogenes DSM 14501]|uniref:Stage 0 sporulation protein A homolog n=1 Tax=Caminicella sporogenes DSM 14501 TaxID=1121266 RepID=A0A1M6NWI8_9FIRM|nr:sigma-54 dependent transcriptional regulator [Caminicella sporogenes]RKD21618.1 sigma-54-dependent Fis family transcriptional regulator [Caminicella sporogenes]SHK00109.1 regulatory protein, Fis family [Caminicella sporogenes DSM 14501]